MFFVISKKILQSKIAVLLANFFFAVNFNLIYYAQEFKQYGVDVFVVLLLIYCLCKIDLHQKTIGYNIMLGCILGLCPLISIPTLYVITTFYFLQFVNFGKSNFLKILSGVIPIIFINLLHYLILLKPSKQIKIFRDNGYWDAGFLSFNPSDLFHNFDLNMKFFLYPSEQSWLILILLVLGFYFTVKASTTFSKMLVGVLTLSVIGSFLHLYPLFTRVSLFLIPIILLIIFAVFDKIDMSKKIFSTMIILLFVSCFIQYDYKYLASVFNRKIFAKENPKELLNILVNNFEQNDIVIYNDASDSEFIFYSQQLNFAPLRVGKIVLSSYGEDWYYNMLELLPKNNDYWFYYPYDYAQKPVVPYLKKWNNKNGKTINEFEIDGSYLLHTRL